MKDLRDEAASLIDRRADETAISRAKMRPIDAFNTSLKTLDTIDMDHIGRLDQKNREEFIRLMGRMRGVLDSFEERLS